MYSLRKISFSVQIKNIIVLAKKNTIQMTQEKSAGFYGKNIFSEHLEKENMFFRVVPTTSF